MNQRLLDVPLKKLGEISMELRKLARVEIQRYYTFAKYCLEPNSRLFDGEITVTWSSISPEKQQLIHEKSLLDLTDEVFSSPSPPFSFFLSLFLILLCLFIFLLVTRCVRVF